MKDGHWIESIQTIKIYVQIQKQFPSHPLDHTVAAILHGPIGMVFIVIIIISRSSSSIFGVISKHRISNEAA